MSTRQVVLEVVAKHAQRDVAKLTPEDVLADVGINSLKFIMLLLELEQTTGCKLMDFDKIGKMKTVGDVLAATQS